MGNRIGLAFLLLVSAFGCSGLREAPDLTGKDGGGDGPTTCTVGNACTPSVPCRIGTTTCGSSGPGCTATQQLQANGTPCGTGMVCASGSCVACAAGSACDLTGTPCRAGTISCTTGAPVCTETNNQPNGTPCGTGMVCQSGQCAACQAGAACTPANPCHQATLSCTTGTPQCLDAETNVPAGTTCGTNRVCTAAGACADCTVGASCLIAGKPCRTGAITCNTGAPVCVESENVQNGTGCGTNMVCSSGACVSCTMGLACTPTNACHAGFTACSPAITCADSGANLVNGTSCGTNKVCNDGVCGACTTGASCQPTNPCRTGATSCVTGTSVCAETGNRPNGTSCGTNQVCNAGACVACAAGGACTPTANPCHVGTLTCNTGMSVCTDTGTAVANGTTCGPNLVCRAGGCVACTAGQTCSPTNPCKLGRTSCATGSSVCTESGNRAVGTLCGAAQMCTASVLTSAAMCNASQACVTTTMSCPNACNAAGTDCNACPTGATMCPSGCRNLATDPANCGSCGTVCLSPPVAGSGSAVCASRACDVSCNAGFLACGNRSYCQVASWGFENDSVGGFSIVGARGAVTSISTSTSVAHSGNTSLAIGIDARRTARRFEVGLTLCDGGFIPAAGQTVTAWIYISPDSGNVPDPHPDSYAGLHLYTNTGDGGDLNRPLPLETWFQVDTQIANVGARLESFSIDGLFVTDGTNDFDWTGVVYVDDITIR